MHYESTVYPVVSCNKCIFFSFFFILQNVKLKVTFLCISTIQGIDLIIIEVSRIEISVTIEIVGTTIGMAGTTTVVGTVIGDHDQEATRDHAVHTIGVTTVQTINRNHHRHHLRRLHNRVIQFQHQTEESSHRNPRISKNFLSFQIIIAVYLINYSID